MTNRTLFNDREGCKCPPDLHKYYQWVIQPVCSESTLYGTIRGTADLEQSFCPCDPWQAEMWTVYGYYSNGPHLVTLADAVTSVTTRKLAERALEQIRRIAYEQHDHARYSK